ALARGAWVICDRFYDSTRAYQVTGGGVDPGVLAALNRLIEAPTPDLTFVLDLDPAKGLARSRGATKGEDRFERKDGAFHAKVRAAFLEIAAAEPVRCVVLDAGKSASEVLQHALGAINTRL
ncbi:MAG: thymidylate kinase, partial [Pseudomonadota bacterium]